MTNAATIRTIRTAASIIRSDMDRYANTTARATREQAEFHASRASDRAAHDLELAAEHLKLAEEAADRVRSAPMREDTISNAELASARADLEQAHPGAAIESEMVRALAFDRREGGRPDGRVGEAGDEGPLKDLADVDEEGSE